MKTGETRSNDCEDYLKRQRIGEEGVEAPDDPKYLLNRLQRFIQLFELDSETEPATLVEQVKTAIIPPKLAEKLGHNTKPKKANDLQSLKRIIAKYLSTDDVLWTIVDECEIAGPFDHWHPHLSLVDLPGTNDTNPHRTAVTNSLRERSQAVAIVTREGNLGNDIESWLRNSTVLSDFLEAKSNRRQHLFIIRTATDAYQPEIDESLLDDADEEREEQLFREAVNRYKDEQAAAYHGMLREIIMPLLPTAANGDPAVTKKREELLERVSNIPVHFISALAHEVFAGRYSVTQASEKPPLGTFPR